MWKRITHNFFAKFLCFGAAVILWVYVSASQNTVGRFPGNIRVKAINVPAGLVPVYDTKQVEIKVMAEPSVWKKLSADSFSAYMDLSNLSAGTFDLPISVVSSVPNVQIVERTPRTILVSLEPVVSKKVAVSKRVEGRAGEGLVAGTVEFNPAEVEIRGPKSKIENITEATAVIALKEETADFQKTIQPAVYDESGEAIGDVEIVPTDVEARVSIVKASNNKTVGIKVNTTGTPKSGYYVSGIVSTPDVIDITGPRTIISDINAIETDPIDLTNADATIEKEVGLVLPGSAALQAGSATKVRVKLTLSGTPISREITITPAFANLDDLYKVSSISPNQLKIIVTGPSPAVGDLKASDFNLTFDLRGRAAGVTSFDVSPAMIKAPENISVDSVLPSAVSVSMEKK